MVQRHWPMRSDVVTSPERMMDGNPEEWRKVVRSSSETNTTLLKINEDMAAKNSELEKHRSRLDDELRWSQEKARNLDMDMNALRLEIATMQKQERALNERASLEKKIHEETIESIQQVYASIRQFEATMSKNYPMAVTNAEASTVDQEVTQTALFSLPAALMVPEQSLQVENSPSPASLAPQTAIPSKQPLKTNGGFVPRNTRSSSSTNKVFSPQAKPAEEAEQKKDAKPFSTPLANIKENIPRNRTTAPIQKPESKVGEKRTVSEDSSSCATTSKRPKTTIKFGRAPTRGTDEDNEGI